jgi:hypothetical protein
MTQTKTMGVLARASVATLCALMVLMVSATSASAQGRALDVEFKDVDVVAARGGALTLEYTIKQKSWRELKRAGISPRINLYVEREDRRGYSYAYSVELDRRNGRIEYPRELVNVRGMRTVEFEVVGFSGANRVDRVTFGSECASTIRLAIARRGKPGGGGVDRPGRGARAQLVAACERQTKFSSELNRCIEEAAALPVAFAAPVVDECGAQTRHATGLYACIEGAATLRHDPVASLQACGAATKYDTEMKACVKRAASFDRPAAPVVTACGAQSRFNSGFNRCLDAAREVSGNRVGQLVEACGAATQHDQGLASCVKTASGLGRDRVALVTQCDAATRYDNELKSCLVRAGRIDEPRRGRTTTRTRTVRTSF